MDDMRRPRWLGVALLGSLLAPIGLAAHACLVSPAPWPSLLPFACALAVAAVSLRLAWRARALAPRALAISTLWALLPVAVLLWPAALSEAAGAIAGAGTALAAGFGALFAAHFPIAKKGAAGKGWLLVGVPALLSLLTAGSALAGRGHWLFVMATLGVAGVWSVAALLLLLHTATRAVRVSAQMSARFALTSVAIAGALAVTAVTWSVFGGESSFAGTVPGAGARPGRLGRA
jgi:hypothetical protein